MALQRLVLLALAAGKRPSDVKVGDINADGLPDLAVTHIGANLVSIQLASCLQ